MLDDLFDVENRRLGKLAMAAGVVGFVAALIGGRAGVYPIGVMVQLLFGSVFVLALGAWSWWNAARNPETGG